jgi:hypothetical protein
MKVRKLLCLIASIFSPNVIQFNLPQGIGAIFDPTSLGIALAENAQNSQSSSGGVNFTASAAATITMTGFGNYLYQLTNGGAVTVTFDSAYNLVQQLSQPAGVGQKFTFNVQTNAGTTVATPTLSDTAVTLSGTTTVLAAAMRWYQGVINQVFTTTGSQWTAGTTFTSLTQVGTTNNYTVALGTNTISPTVGNLIFIGTTAGTLPAGWYPINKVTSATSFVIAAPAASTAWTATAANIGTSTTAPSTYSPLVTITGLMATVTATMSV